MDNPAIIADVGDYHVNSTVALCPEVFKRDGGNYIPKPTQKWIYDCWKHYWTQVWRLKRETGWPVYGVHKGDLVDINTHDHYELISPNQSEILDACVEIMQQPLDVCDYNFVIRGTPSHTGGLGWLEEEVAKRIESVPNEADGTASWRWVPLHVGGVRFGFTHHPGTNSMRPWTTGNAANRAAAMVMSEFYDDDERPDVFSFGHVHHLEDSSFNHPVRALFGLPWKVGDSYTDYLGMAYKLPKIGGYIWTVKDGRARVEPVDYKPERRPFWTPGQQ
jgi:hypothetical protein